MLLQWLNQYRGWSTSLQGEEHNFCAEGSHFMISPVRVAEATRDSSHDSTIMRKCKWLFLNVSGYKSSFSTATEFVNSYRDGTRRGYVTWFIEFNGKTGYVWCSMFTTGTAQPLQFSVHQALPYSSGAAHQHSVQIDSVLKLLSRIPNKVAPE